MGVPTNAVMTSAVFPPLVDIEAALATPAATPLDPLRLAVLREVTVEPLDSYLRYLGRRCRLDTTITFGGFGTLVEEAVGGAAFLDRDLDAVLIFAPLVAVSPALSSRFAALDRHGVEDEVSRITGLFESVVAGIRRQTEATILWHGLEPPIFPSFGILDAQNPDGQAAVIAGLNAALRAALHAVQGAHFVDTAACVARVGGPSFYDARYWHLARAPYTPKALGEIAAEDFKFLRALKGKAKKCLVLDADNTLWGGVVGEDGMSGIKLGATYPGSAFLEFQHQVVSLFHRGVLIALCSRNNEDDVWEVVDRHPDMVLRRTHISAWRINWQDKATSLRELAEELNIGLDSIVLADDSEFEAGLVRDRLPDVEVLQLPAGEPVEYANRLASCGLFETLGLTAEDRSRGEIYRAEATRRRARTEAGDLVSYYQSLEMAVSIDRANGFSIPRIAQLTQKTNQFNLTTRRYGDGDIAAFVASPEHDVFSLRVSDRLGDLGIVGACIVEYVGGQAVLDTFLLSCRALGRGVEQKFLEEILHLCRARGADVVQAEYVRTAKNVQAEEFFVANGFSELEPSSATTRVFTYQLGQLPPRAAGHFSIVASPLDSSPG